jgi:hypothetical protein
MRAKVAVRLENQVRNKGEKTAYFAPGKRMRDADARRIAFESGWQHVCERTLAFCGVE